MHWIEESNGVTYALYRYGSLFRMIVHEPSNRFFYSKEWMIDYSKTVEKANEYLPVLFADLPVIYLATSAMNKVQKHFLQSASPLSPKDGPYNYVSQIPGLQTIVQNPVNKSQMASLEGIIIDLNDTHGWTREEIADWLETLDVNPILN
jgi:hypothetical protein